MNPAVYVLGGPDGYRAVTDDWGAIGLDLDLLAGPDTTMVLMGRASAHGQPLSGTGEGDDDVQAGALVDPERKVLLFFALEGLSVEMRTRRATLALLRAAWPGWDVRWAYGGRTGLRAYAGLDPADDPDRDKRVWESDLFEMDAAGPAVRGLGVSVVTLDGPDRCHPVCYAFDHPVMYGPALLDWLSATTDHGAYHELAVAGLHVDTERRRVGWWLTSHQIHHDTAAARWPGWTVEFWEDRWAEHRTASGGRFDPTEPDDAAALSDVRDAALQHWTPIRHDQDGLPCLAGLDHRGPVSRQGPAARAAIEEAYRSVTGG
ncbi:hypothetical protein ACFVRB_01125 [Streptomyces nojiriensis]|uniref:hypothetical protein n=1 Tax=Streptomyces nojiriensis TaxID=66374 RepID=UPI0036DF032D